MRLKRAALLFALAIAAILVHGYHPAVEDAELYLPAVKQALNPALYPFNGEFFLSHAHLTLFDELIAASVRLLHLPFDYVILLWHIACVVAFLAGCWRVARVCFRSSLAAWGSAALVASLLTIPVAGTALFIMDQYLSTRDISTAGIMLALADALERKLWRAVLLLALIATIHPLMSVFGIVLLVFLYWEQRRVAVPAAAMLAGLPFLQPVSPVYRKILDTSDAYFLVTRWQWYEWLGIAGPLALLFFMGRYAKMRGRPEMAALSRALVWFGLASLIAALVVCIPSLAGLALLQPMRSLHLIFILLFVLIGGILAESVLKSHAWRWAALLVPICLGMFFAQRQEFPATEHLELPGRTPTNAWVQAFEWIRGNTPVDAIFALDPQYMYLDGEDEHGFREIAERSALAGIHDQGAVSMFPSLASDWDAQDQAQRGWKDFGAADFLRLRQRYGVTWVALQSPGVPGLECPYRSRLILVCRVQ